MFDARHGVTPEEVVAAILVQFNENIVPGYYVNYTHNIFRVYVDTDTFSALRPFQNRIREEATLALGEHARRPRYAGAKKALEKLQMSLASEKT